MPACSCSSGKPFNQCCEPIINTQSAPTAIALMRSRYTAYQIGQAEYLYQTTHLSTRKRQDVKDIQQWSDENSWTKLDVISVEHGSINDSRGVVEFKAHYTDKTETEHVLHERSNFLKENGQWFYLDGKINPPEVDLMKKVSRNDPCPCGSGMKYKKCCG